MITDSYVTETKENVRDLKEALRHDRHMLRQDSQELAIAMLASMGRAIVHGGDVESMPFDIATITDAARHAGNKVLEGVGDDQKRRLAGWRKDMRSKMDRHYAEDFACSLVDDLLAHWYIQTALEVYLADIPEDDEDREMLEREFENFKTIARVYMDGLQSNENGIRALTWAARNTHYVTNHRAMLPEGAVPPWFIDPVWYENYGIT